MAYWLMKSEPFKYAFDDLLRDGRTAWDGVRNFAARNNLAAMRVGDEALFYHSNEGKAVVGVMKIIQEAEPDPTVEKDELAKDGRNPWVVVTVAPLKKVAKPLTLEQIRQVKALENMELLRYQRLSVQKVTPAEWEVVRGLAGF